jgi:hypothetical protein
LSDDHTLGTLFFAYWIDSRENGDGAKRSKQQHVRVIDQAFIHGGCMFLPQRAVIERGIDRCTGIRIPEASDPGESGLISALEELPERECPQLLKGLGKIAFEILGEVRPFFFLDGIAAELDDLKVRTMPDVVHARVKSMIQFVSQVCPLSGENACSQRADVLVIFDQV